MGRARLQLLSLWTSFHLTTGSCSGSSTFCAGETTQSGCEFWSGCSWSTSNSGSSASCTGSFSSCARQTTESNCNMWAGCSWGTSSGSGSTGGTGISQTFCFAKIDGSYCNGDTAFTCSDGQITGSQYCSSGNCQETALQASCGDPNFCFAKTAGSYCDGQYVKVCSSGSSSLQIQDCRSAGCSEFTPGSASCGTSNFCAAKSDGTYCDGSVVKRCPSEAVETVCRGVDCQANLVARTASCGSATFCYAKSDGSHCDGAYLKTCSDSTQTALLYCGVCSEGTVGVAECGTVRFCATKISGDYCDGDVWKQCDGSSTPRSVLFCEAGCVQWRTGVAGCGQENDGWLSNAPGHQIGATAAAAALPLLLQ